MLRGGARGREPAFRVLEALVAFGWAVHEMRNCRCSGMSGFKTCETVIAFGRLYSPNSKLLLSGVCDHRMRNCCRFWMCRRSSTCELAKCRTVSHGLSLLGVYAGIITQVVARSMV